MLNTSYLRLNLRSPLVVASCPLSTSLDQLKRMEDTGAGAVVLYSLFEEQVRADQALAKFRREYPHAAPPEDLNPANSYQFRTNLEAYLEHIRSAKQALAIPIIGSLNCTSLGSWIEFAQSIEDAGADAIELNVYYLPTDPDVTSEQTEDVFVRILKAVRGMVKIPISLKLVPFFTALSNLARQLDQSGVDGLVLFNRFYQPDFDPQTLRVQPNLNLSTSADLRLPLHWIAILYRRIRADLAATGGIHTVEDVVKSLMVGAKVTMLASVLLREGIDHLRVLDEGLRTWLARNEYSSVAEVQGLLSQFGGKNPSKTERAEYIRTITSYKPPV